MVFDLSNTYVYLLFTVFRLVEINLLWYIALSIPLGGIPGGVE